MGDGRIGGSGGKSTITPPGTPYISENLAPPLPPTP